MENKSRKIKTLLLRPPSSLENNNFHPRSICVPWTLKYIQSILIRDGYPVFFCDLKAERKALTEVYVLIKKYKPDYIVIQANSLEYADCEILLNMIRTTYNKNIILIGQHISYSKTLPEEVNFIFKGESELKVTDLIKGKPLEKDDQNVIHIVYNLDDLPFPYYEKGELKNYGYPYPIRVKKRIIWGSILGSRGCPYGCVFCTQVLRESYGNILRHRKIDNIINEIKYLISMGANIISFEDDAFTTSAEYVTSLCSQIKRQGINIPWVCQARIDEIDYNMLKEMYTAGCCLIKFGIESGDPLVLSKLGKTSDGNAWIRKTKEVCEMAKKIGIAIAGVFIIDTPGETEESFKQTVHFARRLDLDLIQVCRFTPYPGSLYNTQLIEDFNYKDMYHYDGFKIKNYNYKNFTDSYKSRFFYKSIYFRPSFIIKHLVNYSFFYIFNPEVTFRIFNFKNISFWF